MISQRANTFKAFWRTEEWEGTLPNVDDQFIKDHPDLIARTWWGLIQIDREDLVVKTGKIAYEVKEEVEEKARNGEKVLYAYFRSPIENYSPIIGEMVFMYNYLKVRKDEYTLDEYKSFLRQVFELSAHGYHDLDLNLQLPEDALAWIDKNVEVISDAANRTHNIITENGTHRAVVNF
jgi:hypothetical protein